MADIKISELTAALTVSDADVLPMTASGSTVKVTTALLKEHAIGNTDISGIGDGTPTGAISALDSEDATIKDMIAPTETSPTANSWTTGAQFIYNNVLYDVIADITAGDALTVGTNIAPADTIVEKVEDAVADIAQNASDITTLDASKMSYAVNTKLGAHNRIPVSSIFASGTVNGLTYTVNSNDTVKINGTITTGQTFAHKDCLVTFTLPAGTYSFADGLADGTSANCGIVLRKTNSSGDVLVNTANTAHNGTFSISSDTIVWARIYADSSFGTFNNVMLYPLLKVIEDTDSTYAPYAMTNRELTPQVLYNQNGIYICKQGKIVVAQFYQAKPSDIASLNFASLGAKPVKGTSTFQCRCDSKPTIVDINTNGTVDTLGYYSSYGATFTDLKSDTSKNVFGSICFVSE